MSSLASSPSPSTLLSVRERNRILSSACKFNRPRLIDQQAGSTLLQGNERTFISEGHSNLPQVPFIQISTCTFESMEMMTSVTLKLLTILKIVLHVVRHALIQESHSPKQSAPNIWSLWYALLTSHFHIQDRCRILLFTKRKVIKSKRWTILTSEALEISSRRKMSLLLYRELMIMSINLETSAWNSNFSPSLLSVFGDIDSPSLHPKA